MQVEICEEKIPGKEEKVVKNARASRALSQALNAG